MVEGEQGRIVSLITSEDKHPRLILPQPCEQSLICGIYATHD